MTTEPEYTLVMPLVTVTSAGGPHDDNAYTAGYEAGRLDGYLAVYAATGAVGFGFTITVRTDNVPQVDLIAMRHGFIAALDEDADHVDGWTTLRFTQGALP